MNPKIKTILKVQLIVAVIMWIFGAFIYYTIVKPDILLSVGYGLAIALVGFILYVLKDYYEYRQEKKELALLNNSDNLTGKDK